MHDLTAKRTLVKSAPELWSELSEVERLARHLGAFGEIKITKLEPERTVAWEGDAASGTVMIEPSGWGTKVTLQAQVQGSDEAEAQADPEQAADLEPEPAPQPPAPVEHPAEALADPFGAEPGPPVRTGFFARLFGWGPREELVESEPAAQPEPAGPPEPERAPAPGPVAADPEPEPQAETPAPGLGSADAQAVLEDALEALGSAHHRPFSRG